MSARVQVLGGYRRLLRASRQAFRGDDYAIQQARLALRDNFLENRDVRDQETVAELIKGIDEAEGMLLHHIVQGRQKAVEDSGAPRYEVTITDPQRQAMRQDEELTPITEKSASEPLVISSGNVCQRPS
uniref:Complex 1 LYR protein domain-containing protein n=1 Tax=Globisporangium ultimum (strain ATCC 200006 / CBS 805.95 / DAOM BR144) TaxID=431595 RepID=K3W819_GLOUD